MGYMLRQQLLRRHDATESKIPLRRQCPCERKILSPEGKKMRAMRSGTCRLFKLCRLRWVFRPIFALGVILIL